ncbi:DUF2256 domain-containing protein [Herbiconiux sp. YIM B11900]|uniref:DUF2256 domain-containing protein n=1 Tax=Herbiconiux sp. YIM B11900 TaxID=3404131 RepID=UPI003F86C2F7
MARSRTTGQRATRREQLAPASAAAPEPKVCASCGRTIQWRAKWARSWDDVRYCSVACRRRGVSAADLDLERMLLEALARRPGGAALGLDEFAAEFAPPADTTDASAHREQVRRAARRLAARGRVEWLQGGRPVDPSTARGPAGIRLLPSSSSTRR